MELQEYKVLGHKINYNVPSTTEEFNKLDQKRTAAGIDAALAEAKSNIVYRSMNPDTRWLFLHGRDAEAAKDGRPAVTALKGVEDQVIEMIGPGPFNISDVDEDWQKYSARGTKEVKGKDGKTRMKDGVAVTKFIESEEVYYNRALSLLVHQKKFASEDAAREHFQPQIAAIASEIPFDPTEREIGERGPRKLKAMYKVAAAKVLAKGNVDKLNANALSKISKSFSPTNDSSVMFTGKYPDKDKHGKEIEVDFNVSDKDAEALGWLIKEFQDWKAQQELAELSE